MIEPELAFADLNDDMACATAYLQYVVGFPLHFSSFYACVPTVCSIFFLYACIPSIVS